MTSKDSKMSKPNNKTILFTLEYPPFKGGIANYYENLVKYWGDDIFILTNGKKIEGDTPNIIRKPLVSKHAWLKWYPSFFYLLKIITNYKLQITNYNIIVGHILPLGTVCYFLSKIIKLRYSVILHGMDLAYALKTEKKKKLTRKILKNSEKIICGNSYTKNLVQSFDSNLKNKLSIVNPGIDTHFVRNPKKTEELKNKYNLNEKIVLFSIGRLVKRKGFDKTIESLPQILKKIPNLAYVIAGSGEDEAYLKNKAKKLPNNIIFLGNISNEDRSIWFNICDIFIMPARNINGDFEGFGIVYLEAGLLGKPVIAGDSGGVRDAVIDNVSGLLVNPENTQDISEKIIKLALDPKLRNELGEQGKRRAVVNFTWEKQIEKLKNIII